MHYPGVVSVSEKMYTDVGKRRLNRLLTHGMQVRFSNNSTGSRLLAHCPFQIRELRRGGITGDGRK